MPIYWICSRFNIEILLADATKPEKSNIPTLLDLTCDVISDI